MSHGTKSVIEGSFHEASFMEDSTLKVERLRGGGFFESPSGPASNGAATDASFCSADGTWIGHLEIRLIELRGQWPAPHHWELSWAAGV